MPPSPPQPGSVGPDTTEVGLARKGRLRKLRKITVLARRPAWRRAARSGVAATIEHRDVPFGNDFATVIDVGAHHGQFTLLARALFPHAEIVCIEPLPDTLERLRRTVAGDERVTVLAAAAASRNEQRQLHVSEKTDSSSLLAILDPYIEAFPGTSEARVVDVEAKTLDTLLPEAPSQPCLLKVDAQGGELEVFSGASALLAHVDVVFVECSFVEFYRGQALADEIIGALFAHGLRLDGVYSVVEDSNRRCLQADLLFRRPSG